MAKDNVHTASLDGVNGLRTLELGAALNWLKEQLVTRMSGGSQTISTIGRRTKEEQITSGMVHILFVMFPFAIELALKSLKACLHAQGKYDHEHGLVDLFLSLTVDAKDTNEAQKAQDDARESWRTFQGTGSVRFTGTLDEFLAEHSKDFINIRYYHWGNIQHQELNDLVYCYYSIIAPLVTRDSNTAANFKSLFPSLQDI